MRPDVPPDRQLRLTAGVATARIDVGAGGRLAELDVAGQALLADPPPAATAIEWGAYVMAPWAGRLRNGRFTFAGREYQLQCNHRDADPGGGPSHDPARRHAIHGTVFDRPWTVERSGVDSAVLSCPLEGAAGWPFPGVVRSTIVLAPDRLRWDVTVETVDPGVPLTVGWHPWFRKAERVEFEPTAMYVRDDVGVATGELVDPAPPPWDDCFLASGPVRLHYDRDVAPVVTITSDCDHWVLFDERPHATCVEPQSGPPDALNIRPNLATSRGAQGRTMSVLWRELRTPTRAPRES